LLTTRPSETPPLRSRHLLQCIQLISLCLTQARFLMNTTYMTHHTTLRFHHTSNPKIQNRSVKTHSCHPTSLLSLNNNRLSIFLRSSQFCLHQALNSGQSRKNIPILSPNTQLTGETPLGTRPIKTTTSLRRPTLLHNTSRIHGALTTPHHNKTLSHSSRPRSHNKHKLDKRSPRPPRLSRQKTPQAPRKRTRKATIPVVAK